MPGASSIDLGPATLLPGLIDAHVHPGWYVDRQGKRNSQRSGDTQAQAALARAGNLYATLVAGFTTIQSVGATTSLPLRKDLDYRLPFGVTGRAAPANIQEQSAIHRMVTTGYFRTMGVQLKSGRDFNESDTATGLGLM